MLGLTALARFALVEHWINQRLSPWDADSAQLERLHTHLVWRCMGASMEDVAASIGTSVRSLRRWIGDATGIAPKQLELSGRVLRACAALHERPRTSIAAIAHEFGFSDQAAFAHAFHAHTAMTPRAFRAEPLVFYERGPGWIP